MRHSDSFFKGLNNYNNLYYKKIVANKQVPSRFDFVC